MSRSSHRPRQDLGVGCAPCHRPSSSVARRPTACGGNVARVAAVPTNEPEERPRVTASFVDPDELARPLLIAIGRVVLAVAGLEKSMQLELSRLKLVQRATEPHPSGRS